MCRIPIKDFAEYILHGTLPEGTALQVHACKSEPWGHRVTVSRGEHSLSVILLESMTERHKAAALVDLRRRFIRALGLEPVHA